MKMSEAAKKRMANPDIPNKIHTANIGKKHSLETIAKRVEKLKGETSNRVKPVTS